MRLLSLILLPLGLLIELIAVWAFLADKGLLMALLVHLIGCVAVVAGVYLALPDKYREPRGGGLVFLALCTALVPVLGAVGLAAGALPGLYFAYREEPKEWDALPIPDLPFQPIEVKPNDVFMRDGLAAVLMHFDDRNRRQQAILACRHLPNRQAVPILRSALSDSADEVRLLAYAMLNSIERDLERRIGVLDEAIGRDGDADGELNEERAQLFWEFSYLQLTRGTVEELMLTKALASIDNALQRQHTAYRWLLRARICLALKRYDEAEQALQSADSLGLDKDDSAPYWAELAFCRGRFEQVAPALRAMSSDGISNPVMQPVVEYWT